MSRYIIDKSKLIENINIIKNKAGVEVIGVVKATATASECALLPKF